MMKRELFIVNLQTFLLNFMMNYGTNTWGNMFYEKKCLPASKFTSDLYSMLKQYWPDICMVALLEEIIINIINSTKLHSNTI